MNRPVLINVVLSLNCTEIVPYPEIFRASDSRWQIS